MLDQGHRFTSNARRGTRARPGRRKQPGRGRRTLQSRGRRESRFETVVAPARLGVSGLGYTRGRYRDQGRPRKRGNQKLGQYAGHRAQYGHATSRRGALAGWLSARERPAAAGRVAFNIAILSLLGWALVWFFASDRFYVSEIVVTGNKRLSADVIRRASGLQGYSTFWIDPRRTAARIMDSLPPLTSIEVQHDLSNRVTLVVQEQEGQIIWQRSGVRYWVDDKGHLSPVQEEGQSLGAEWAPTAEHTLLVKEGRAALDAPHLRGAASGDRASAQDAPADVLSVDPDALVAARQIIHLLPQVRVVEYLPAVGLRYLAPSGWMVYLGTGSDMAHKVNVLWAIELQFAGKDGPQPTLIDLRYPDSPYYRLPADDLLGAEGD